MFGWEIPFGKMIDTARQKELNILRKNSYVRGLYMTFAMFTTRMAVFCTMLSICLMYGNENITASKVILKAIPNVNKMKNFLTLTDFRNSGLFSSDIACYVSNVC